MAAHVHDEETRALALLPGLAVEVVHRRPAGEGLETLTLTLRAAPSFEQIGRMLEAGNPLLLPILAWTRIMQAAWAPWLALLGPRRRAAG
jgi:hypothetical protein